MVTDLNTSVGCASRFLEAAPLGTLTRGSFTERKETRSDVLWSVRRSSVFYINIYIDCSYNKIFLYFNFFFLLSK